MGRRSLAILVAAVALAIVIAGCGGGSSDEGLTKAEFIKKGNAICEEVNKEFAAEYRAFLDSIGVKPGKYANDAQAHEVAEEVYLPSVERRIEELRGLNPPS